MPTAPWPRLPFAHPFRRCRATLLLRNDYDARRSSRNGPLVVGCPAGASFMKIDPTAARETSIDLYRATEDGGLPGTRRRETTTREGDNKCRGRARRKVRDRRDRIGRNGLLSRPDDYYGTRAVFPFSFILSFHPPPHPSPCSSCSSSPFLLRRERRAI